MTSFDFKKEYKDLYLPPKKPTVIDVPKMRFVMVDGQGDPNTSEYYKKAVELLYGISYGIKMSKKTGNQPKGYFDYVVPPLEGLCARTMHIGPYDNEPLTVSMLDAFISEQGYRTDMSGSRKHHEIYLGDPRKTVPEKLKTVIRHPIAGI